MSRILVIGGAGFIGTNLTRHLLSKGHQVTVYDNLSRRGSEKNLEWLRRSPGNHEGLSSSEAKEGFKLLRADIRDYGTLEQAVDGVDIIYNASGQVAVTTSVAAPLEDFEINALGAVNLLEAVRRVNPSAIVVYTSTNKVYGKMDGVPIVERCGRYDYEDLVYGVSETQPLDFYSPYGCSKGSADQYMRDYARIYGLRTIVFRMSCIYGTRQFGNEDQGWVAHFAISSAFDWPLTIYGDGKQVRDILFIDDLLRAFELAIDNIDVTRGQIYNIGGGRENAISLLELIEELEELLGRRVKCSFDSWRPGDQKVFICDIRKAKRDLSWMPQIPKKQGIERLLRWVQKNKAIF
jgi:CDP-paratose 2-epimerase